MHDSGYFGVNTTFTSSYVQLGRKQLLWSGGGKGFKPILGESVSYIQRILLFLFYSCHLDNDIWIPIYKTIPAICNTPRQTQCVQNSIFPHFIIVIMLCCGCGLWLCVGALSRGCAKNIQKTASTQESQQWKYHAPARQLQYSDFFLVILTFARLMPRVLRQVRYDLRHDNHIIQLATVDHGT